MTLLTRYIPGLPVGDSATNISRPPACKSNKSFHSLNSKRDNVRTTIQLTRIQALAGKDQMSPQLKPALGNARAPLALDLDLQRFPLQTSPLQSLQSYSSTYNQSLNAILQPSKAQLALQHQPIQLETMTSMLTNSCIHSQAEIAQQLIQTVEGALNSLNVPSYSTGERSLKHDLRTATIELLDHYLANYWLPVALTSLPASAWNALVEQAIEQPATAHFLSLLLAQFAYSANGDHQTQLEQLSQTVTQAGLQLLPITIASKHNRTETKVAAGYCLAHPKGLFVGFAGTQAATLGQNLQAHLKAKLDGAHHWGYHDYYHRTIEPALCITLAQLKPSLRNAHQTIHIGGHSLGGAISQLAAAHWPQLRGQQTKTYVHSFNGVRAGGALLQTNLNNHAINVINSGHTQDVVRGMPPAFMGFTDHTLANNKVNPWQETGNALRLFAHNCRNNFVHHRLAPFVLAICPSQFAGALALYDIPLPNRIDFQRLGYFYETFCQPPPSP